jgi:hypothetical protein
MLFSVKMKRIIIAAIFVMLFSSFAIAQTVNQISDARKKDFIELLKTLPYKGEFYNDEAIDKSQNYLPVLFALTEKDIKNYDIYPFLALSRGLCDLKASRNYAVRNFSEIRHPTLKLFWAAMLFDAKATSSEIVQFLRDALKSKEQSKTLSEMIGPDYKDFQRKVKIYKDEKK